jgi:tRNA nucleotidyltransferase (CCA-adding enzyme)
MHLILTHEQADFDAIAAMLGVYLLNERAIPVLPRRLNRNLRTFLTLYGSELPFVETRDLPLEPVESITLVDTQSLVTPKGMGQETLVQVIDHHQLRSDLPADWLCTIERLGACTTLVVEQMQTRSERLNPLHATLMLLGIYEDTGSLTYTSTTPRDVRAAAYLLEEGASLRIVSEYLNPPLSSEQLQVQDRLLESAQTHYVNGQKIIISCAQAEDLSEEVSSIAHKLRDVLEPDGLFVLVQTRDGIRMVARSTSDRVDVSQIAAHFGGGGHARAAAALIRTSPESEKRSKTPPLERIYNELLRILPKYVHPPITVGQMMSSNPRVITPTTSVTDAAQLMQRYGYEGFPVVENGKVVGLLTRRAVDRAIAHRLNLTAGSLMEAGEVTVRPDDTLEKLQYLMVTHGWGQVPVVSPESGEIIGIVTRTDLLKTLAAANHHPHPERKNLSHRLEAALPPARLALLRMIAERARAQHLPTYVVGGFVRDLLLERPGLDFDIVVEGNAIALGRALVAEFGGNIITHKRFGTAKWQIGEIRAELAARLNPEANFKAEDLPTSLDLISSRTEFYAYPTALPTVERGSIKLDLYRRDFTINTMALRLDGRHYGDLYDFWGGYRDLQNKRIRVLHPLSFFDDPTRMLRAVRFEQRFGFTIEERTLQLISEARPLLRQTSGPRLRHELDLILREENPEAMLARLEELQLLKPIHPALQWTQAIAPCLRRVLFEPIDPVRKLEFDADPPTTRMYLAYLVWLNNLTEETLQSIAERLKFPNVLLKSLIGLARLRRELPNLVTLHPSRIVNRLDVVPHSALYVLYCLTQDETQKSLLLRYMTQWQTVRPKTTGLMLRAKGLPPGKSYSRILNTLRAAWLNGEIATEEEENALLEHLLSEEQLANRSEPN